MPWYQMLLVVAAIFAGSFALGGYLSSRWRMPDYFGKFTLILFTVFAGIAICVLGWNDIKLGIDLRGGVIMVYQLMDSAEDKFAGAEQGQPVKRRAQAAAANQSVNMDQLVGAISKRINPGGIKEVTIRPLGSKQIEIIIPEVNPDEVARIRSVLGKVGTLEFRILATDKNANYARWIQQAKLLPNNETSVYNSSGEREAFWVPVQESREDEFARNPEIATRWIPKRGKQQLQVLVISDPWNVTGQYLNRAQVGVDETGQPDVKFSFNSTGANLFGQLTGTHRPDEIQNFKYHLGIILDGELRTAPYIKSTITSEGQISGGFTLQQAQNLVDVLNAGALPAALSPEPVSQQYIGPTLGRDTIQRGLLSLEISLAVVFAFVLIYYRLAGIVAAIALVLNGVLLLAIMITIKAAFTLPGLAGFALTIAMAVDANVLIFERMREEAHRGASFRMTIRNGFERALSAIVDSNLTTLITAVVLYVIGTDQVRGFAVTLFLGIVLSMYTAIFIARVMFDVVERRRWLDRLKMMQIIGETHINFLGHKWIMIGISSGIILLGLVGVVHRGRGLLDIDFTGGVSVQVAFDKPQDIALVREKIEKQTDMPDVVVSDVKAEGVTEGTQFIINTATKPDMDAEEYLGVVKQELQNVFGNDLSHNSVKITGISAVSAEAPKAGVPASGAPAKPAEPKPGAQSSLSPPSPRPEPAALSPLLLGQAEKAKEPAKSEPAKPEAKTEAKPATKPAEKPAEKPSATVSGTQADLTFDFPVTHDSLERTFQQAIKDKVGATATPDLVLSSKEYEEGSMKPYSDWHVQIALPQAQAQQVFDKVKTDLETSAVFPSSNTIGGAVASITRYRAVYALLASTLFILIYLWIRFQRISYGLGAVASLVHDVLMALGFIALSYYLSKIPFVSQVLLIEPFKVNLTVVTALLTLAGYSLNDTIVVFDRIREVRGKAPQVTQDMINLSINQTLGRTILTGLTTFLVIVVLYILGGPTIHGFAFAMIIGVVTGMYSSIYIASPFLLWIAGAPAEQPSRRAAVAKQAAK